MRQPRARCWMWAGCALALGQALSDHARGQGDAQSDPGGAHRVRGARGEVVPRFALPDLDSNEHTLEQHLRRGHGVVLEWIAPESEEWRALHGPAGALRATRDRHRADVAWLTVCTFAVPERDEEPAGRPPIVASGRSSEPITQQARFWGDADGQRPSWDRARPRSPADWPWYEQPPAPPFEGPTGRLGRDEAVRTARRAAETLGLGVPVLLDAGGTLAARLGVTRAPHVVVVDRQGRLAYAGPPVAADGTNRVAEVLAALERPRTRESEERR